MFALQSDIRRLLVLLWAACLSLNPIHSIAVALASPVGNWRVDLNSIWVRILAKEKTKHNLEAAQSLSREYRTRSGTFIFNFEKNHRFWVIDTSQNVPVSGTWTMKNNQIRVIIDGHDSKLKMEYISSNDVIQVLSKEGDLQASYSLRRR